MTLAGLPAPPSEPRGALRGTWRICFPGARHLLVAVLVCILLPVALVAIHVHENPSLSPIDEWAHYDYVDEIAAGRLPRLGELLLPSTMRTMACQGIDLKGVRWPPCSAATTVARDFGASAYQYEAQQPPGYYAISALLRAIPAHLGVSQLNATRLVGAFWLALGLSCLWIAGRLLGISSGALAIGMVLLASSPAVLYESSVVTDSATGVFAGSLLCLLASLTWRHPGRWAFAALAIAAFVVSALDADNALAAGVIAVLFVLVAWARRGASGRWVDLRWLGYAAALVAGSAASILIWLAIFNRRVLIAPGSLPTYNFLRIKLRTEHIGKSLALVDALPVLQPLTHEYVAYRSNRTGALLDPALGHNLQVAFAGLLEFLILAPGLAWFVVREKLWTHWMGLVSLPVLYLGGIVIGISFVITYKVPPATAGRYGLAVAPLLLLALVGSLHDAAAKYAVGAFAAFGAALTVYLMIL